MKTKGRRQSTNVQSIRGNPRAKSHMFRGTIKTMISNMMDEGQKKPNLRMGNKAGMPGMKTVKQARVKKGK